MARVASLARNAWAGARAGSDFKAFQPFLQQTIDLKKRYVDCIGGGDDPYGVLLDDYERGMPTAEVRRIFAALKEATVPLIAAVAARGDVVDDSCLQGEFPVEQQRAFCLSLLRRLGYTDREWRFDPTAHPFSTNMNLGDIRLTTRYQRRHHRPGGVRPDPRVRARAVRTWRQPVAGTNAALRRGVAGPARVAEPPLGEPRRQEPRGVDVLPPRTEAGVSRSTPPRGRGDGSIAPSTRCSRGSSASTPTS